MIHSNMKGAVISVSSLGMDVFAKAASLGLQCS